MGGSDLALGKSIYETSTYLFHCTHFTGGIMSRRDDTPIRTLAQLFHERVGLGNGTVI